MPHFATPLAMVMLAHSTRLSVGNTIGNETAFWYFAVLSAWVMPPLPDAVPAIETVASSSTALPLVFNTRPSVKRPEIGLGRNAAQLVVLCCVPQALPLIFPLASNANVFGRLVLSIVT